MQDFSYRQIDDGTYCITGYRGDEAQVEIPERFGRAPVTVLYDKLFSGHAEITSVRIPETVTDMGEFIFDGCENLRHIELPRALTALWGYTFCRSSIEEIVLPDGLKILPPFAFKDCKNLRKVVCGAGMKEISAWVFGGCDSLKEVLFGAGVKVSPLAFETKILNT